MDRIDLAGLARRKAGPGPKRIVIFRPIPSRQGAKDDLERAIVKIQREAWKVAKEHLIVAGAEAVAAIHDDNAGRLASAMKLIRNILASALAGIVADWTLDRIFNGEEERHRQRLVEQVKARVGIDLGYIISRDNLSEVMNLAMQRAVGAIQGLNDDVAKRVEAKIMTAVLSGLAAPALAKILSETFGWAMKRAKFIARDQIETFNGNLNKFRQQQLGVTKYKWSTAMDERVRGNPDGRYPHARPSHWAREGETFSWDDPPEGGHPGEDYNCRCVAIAVLEF